MSFILDALKKSETDRQRQSGPALYEVKVAAPRSPLPHWAIGLLVLLGINLVVVAWALLKRPVHPADAPTVAAATSTPPPAVPSSPPPAAVTTAASVPTGPTAQAPVAQAPVAPSSAPVMPGPAPYQGADPAGNVNAATAASREPQEAPGNPDDYAPAEEPTTQSPGAALHARRGTEAGIPLYSQLATDPSSGIPDLRLDMNSWSPRPESRFVLINMKQLHEGDMLSQGIKVESITPEGVILSHNGTKFLLTE